MSLDWVTGILEGGIGLVFVGCGSPGVEGQGGRQQPVDHDHNQRDAIWVAS